MASVDAAVRLGNQPISVGGVISQLLATIGRHWLVLYAFALAFVPLNCVQFLTTSMPKGTTLTLINAAVIAAQLIGGLFVQAALTYALVQMLSGGVFALRDGFSLALRRFFPYLGAALLTYLICGIGGVLLLIPGIIAFCVYAQAPVVAIVERTGPIASQSRSRQMTRNNRWRIFAVLLIVYLPFLITFGAISAYTAVLTFKAAAAGRGDTAGIVKDLGWVPVATVILTFVLAPLSFAWPAVLYHRLQRAEGSAGPANLAEVFA